jgi:hypothetical protein
VLRSIMDESMRLRRLIRDEKEEVERREGMDEDGAGGEGDGEGHTPRPGLASGNATPRPDAGSSGPGAKSRGVTPGIGVEDASTPRPTSRGSASGRDSGGDGDEQLKPMSSLRENHSRSVSRTGSREGTPLPAIATGDMDAGGADIDMQDASQTAETVAGREASGNERNAQEGADEQMDTT